MALAVILMMVGFLGFVATQQAQAYPANGTVQGVSHTCEVLAGSSSTGLRGVVCIDLSWIFQSTYITYKEETEFICQIGAATIQCNGAIGRGQERVGTLQPSHLFQCGNLGGSACSVGRNYDRSIASANVPKGTCPTWVGSLTSYTLNVRGLILPTGVRHDFVNRPVVFC